MQTCGQFFEPLYVLVKMSHRSLRNRMEGSDYEDRCGQQTDDMGGMSNHVKER